MPFVARHPTSTFLSTSLSPSAQAGYAVYLRQETLLGLFLSSPSALLYPFPPPSFLFALFFSCPLWRVTSPTAASCCTSPVGSSSRLFCVLQRVGYPFCPVAVFLRLWRVTPLCYSMRLCARSSPSRILPGSNGCCYKARYPSLLLLCSPFSRLLARHPPLLQCTPVGFRLL